VRGQHGRIALIGSGELTPSMVEVHKELLAAAPQRSGAFFLDTPAGFQPNAEDISRKAQDYFSHNVQHSLSIASLKSMDDVSTYEVQQLARKLENAEYLLVGPGSPTYMIRQLRDSSLIPAMINIVKNGGSIAIASAAALTAGSMTLPVYEIYKAGFQLFWEKGLDLLSHFDLDVVIVPHWNNAEGGTHDTRFCYMGEDRFTRLKQLLPSHTVFLGVDEHTACIVDFGKSICRVKGQGTVTLQQGDKQIVVSKDQSFSLNLLRSGIEEVDGEDFEIETVPAEESGSKIHGKIEEAGSFWEMVHIIERKFHKGLAGHDFKSATNALLSLESHISKASSNLENEEDLAQTREIFRELIVHLGLELQAAQGTIEQYRFLVDTIVELRGNYKKRQMWAESDMLRDVLDKSNIIVMDKRDATTWHLKYRKPVDEQG